MPKISEGALFLHTLSRLCRLKQFKDALDLGLPEADPQGALLADVPCLGG